MSDVNGGSTPSGDDDATAPDLTPAAPSRGDDGLDRGRRRWLLPVLFLVGGVVAGVVAVLLLTGGDGDDGDSAKSSVAVTKPASTAPPTTTRVTSPSTTAAPSGGGSSATTAPPPTVVPQTAVIGPVIVTFTSTSSSFSCNTSATFQAPTDITLSWTTQNATGVDLSVDGGGIYGSYGPQGSQKLTVPCDGNTHTYKLTAKGAAGQTTSKTVSVSTTKN